MGWDPISHPTAKVTIVHRGTEQDSLHAAAQIRVHIHMVFQNNLAMQAGIIIKI